jgi:hypothetical protein
LVRKRSQAKEIVTEQMSPANQNYFQQQTKRKNGSRSSQTKKSPPKIKKN